MWTIHSSIDSWVLWVAATMWHSIVVCKCVYVQKGSLFLSLFHHLFSSTAKKKKYQTHSSQTHSTAAFMSFAQNFSTISFSNNDSESNHTHGARRNGRNENRNANIQHEWNIHSIQVSIRKLYTSTFPARARLLSQPLRTIARKQTSSKQPYAYRINASLFDQYGIFNP